MTVFKVVYAATMLILWLCIILNAACVLRSKKLMKDYLAAIEAARAAEKNFLEAAETYHTMCKELQGGCGTMKIPQEFTFSVKGGRDKIVILNCDLLDMAAHVSYLLHNLYGRMLVREPMMAEAFKEIIINSIGNPDGPCWDKEPLKPAETEIYFTTPKTPDNPT